MAGKGKPGRDSSGRKQVTLRLWHYETYLAEAQEQGLDFTAYVNRVLAERRGLSVPDDPGQRADQLALDDERHEGAA